jgi:hypothetical protein
LSINSFRIVYTHTLPCPKHRASTYVLHQSLQASMLEQQISAAVEEGRSWQARASELESQMQSVRWMAEQESAQLQEQSAALMAQLGQAQEGTARVRRGPSVVFGRIMMSA